MLNYVFSNRLIDHMRACLQGTAPKSTTERDGYYDRRFSYFADGVGHFISGQAYDEAAMLLQSWTSSFYDDDSWITAARDTSNPALNIPASHSRQSLGVNTFSESLSSRSEAADASTGRRMSSSGISTASWTGRPGHEAAAPHNRQAARLPTVDRMSWHRLWQPTPSYRHSLFPPTLDSDKPPIPISSKKLCCLSENARAWK